MHEGRTVPILPSCMTAQEAAGASGREGPPVWPKDCARRGAGRRPV